MNKCIWCLKSEPEATFKQRAHILPQSLGSNRITKLECDSCNNYFGNGQNGRRSIELCLKEAFNITRQILLRSNNPNVKKFSSEFFKLDEIKNKLSIRPQFKLKKDFQIGLGYQFKKGLYKVTVEYLSAEMKFGLENEFQSIRDFVRYDSGDLPVYYFPRIHGIFYGSPEMIQKPDIVPLNNWKNNVIKNDFFAFEILNHRFVIPLSNDCSIDLICKNEHPDVFKNALSLKKMTDVDLTLIIAQQ